MVADHREKIKFLCSAISRSSDSIAAFANIDDAYAGDEELGELYEDMILDELRHVQLITLELTKLMTEDTNMDDSDAGVFAEGELNSVIGKKEKDESLEDLREEVEP